MCSSTAEALFLTSVLHPVYIFWVLSIYILATMCPWQQESGWHSRMKRAATHVLCPVASEVSGGVLGKSAMTENGQFQGQHECLPYSTQKPLCPNKKVIDLIISSTLDPRFLILRWLIFFHTTVKGWTNYLSPMSQNSGLGPPWKKFLGQRLTSPIWDPRVIHLLDKIANTYVRPPII